MKKLKGISQIRLNRNQVAQLVMLILSILIICIWIIVYKDHKKISWYSWGILFIGTTMLIHFLPNWKVFKPFKLVTGVLVALSILIKPIYKTLSIVFMSSVFIFYIVLAGTNLIIKHTMNINTMPAGIYFLAFTITTFYLRFLGGITFRAVIRFFNRNKPPLESAAEVELMKSTINNQGARLIIYFLYSILLFIVSFCKLSNYRLFEIEHLDDSLIQAFATFIAFDTMIQIWKMEDISIVTWLGKLSAVYGAQGVFKDDPVNEDKN